MEKGCMMIGFVVFFFSFLAAIVIGNAWLWGCVAGTVLFFLGEFFSEEY